MFLVVRGSTVIRGGVRGQKGVKSTFRQPQPMKQEQRKSWHEDAVIENIAKWRRQILSKKELAFPSLTNLSKSLPIARLITAVGEGASLIR